MLDSTPEISDAPSLRQKTSDGNAQSDHGINLCPGEEDDSVPMFFLKKGQDTPTFSEGSPSDDSSQLARRTNDSSANTQATPQHEHSSQLSVITAVDTPTPSPAPMPIATRPQNPFGFVNGVKIYSSPMKMYKAALFKRNSLLFSSITSCSTVVVMALYIQYVFYFKLKAFSLTNDSYFLVWFPPSYQFFLKKSYHIYNLTNNTQNTAF